MAIMYMLEQVEYKLQLHKTTHRIFSFLLPSFLHPYLFPYLPPTLTPPFCFYLPPSLPHAFLSSPSLPYSFFPLSLPPSFPASRLPFLPLSPSLSYSLNLSSLSSSFPHSLPLSSLSLSPLSLTFSRTPLSLPASRLPFLPLAPSLSYSHTLSSLSPFFPLLLHSKVSRISDSTKLQNFFTLPEHPDGTILAFLRFLNDLILINVQHVVVRRVFTSFCFSIVNLSFG